MIQFKYKNFTEKGSTSNLVGNTIGAGVTGLMGYGMIQSHKQMKNAEKEHRAGISAMDQQTAAINKNLDATEKSFAVPLLAGLGAGSTAMGVASTGLMAGGMIQSHNQGKKQEQMNEEQVAAQERQTQAIQRQNAVLQRMAEKGNSSPEKVSQVVNRNFSSVLSERNYGFSMSGITTAAQDLVRAGKKAGMGKGIKSNLAFGAVTGAAAYGAGKLISHDMKKSGLDIDQTGNLVQKQKTYAVETVAKSGTNGVEQQTKKKAAGFLGKMGTPLFAAAFEAPKVIGYYGEKRALKNQIAGTNNTPQVEQRSYTSVLKRKFFDDSQPEQQKKKMGLGTKLAIGAGTLATAAGGIYAAKRGVFGKTIQQKPFFQHTRQTLSGFANVLGSFGVTNTKAVQDTAKNLSTSARSKTMQKFGQWAQNHKTAANMVALVPGTALGMGAFGLAEKAVKKPMKAVDPDAYKYQETKDAAAKQKVN